jgi:acyl-CoA synthetase (NDP forming)
VIVSAGFGEVGGEGIKEQKDLEEVIRKTGIRCLGPNTVGLVNVQKNLFGSFVPFENWLNGPVAIGAQSGIFAGALAHELMHMKTQRIGICKSLSLGNMMDIDETDFLEYAWKDSACRVIAFYLERIKRPRPFLALANKVKREKPIIVLKSGRTDYGAKAALSHTGSLAIKDHLVDISFRQYGIIRTYTLQEFLCTLRAFAYQPVPRGNRIGVITYSGANGVIASDEIYEAGLKLAEFKEETLKRLKNIMPEWQPVRNPADLWVALGVGRNRKVYEESMNAVLEDENVDVLLYLLLGLPNSDASQMREVFLKAMQAHPKKPILVSIIGGTVKERWISEFEGLSVPIYPDTSLAVKAIKAMYVYYTVKDYETVSPLTDSEGSPKG